MDNGNKAKPKRTTKTDKLTFSEKTAAKRLGVSYITLFRLRKKGAIPFYRVGGRVLYDDQCLREYLARNRRDVAAA